MLLSLKHKAVKGCVSRKGRQILDCKGGIAAPCYKSWMKHKRLKFILRCGNSSVEHIGIDRDTVPLCERKALRRNLELEGAAYHISDFPFFMPVPGDHMLRSVRIEPLIGGAGKAGGSVGIQLLFFMIQIQIADIKSHRGASDWSVLLYYTS